MDRTSRKYHNSHKYNTQDNLCRKHNNSRTIDVTLVAGLTRLAITGFAAATFVIARLATILWIAWNVVLTGIAARTIDVTLVAGLTRLVITGFATTAFVVTRLATILLAWTLNVAVAWLLVADLATRVGVTDLTRHIAGRVAFTPIITRLADVTADVTQVA